MKVVLLSTNMARGGAETQVALLATRLRRRGWDVRVISMMLPTAFERELAAADVPLHAPGIPWIPALLRRIRPQILHCHMFHANIMGRLLGLIMPFEAVISTLHSAAESKRSSGSLRHRDIAYRLSDRLASATVAVSDAVAARHREAKAVHAPRVIPNGVDTDMYRPDPEVRRRLRSELGIGDEFTWIAAGRLMWKKNYPLLLQALAALGRGRLLIAGAGPDEAELRRQANSNVLFLGQRDDLPALLNAADGFVLSSSVEGMPLALLEAGATALPCVATDVGGVREMGIGLVVEPDGLAAGMDEIMSMPPQVRAELGAAARRRVLGHYSLDAVVTQWEALYHSLARWT
jgi:glycosyltransferase involved in cell wall biosynthesis